MKLARFFLFCSFMFGCQLYGINAYVEKTQYREPGKLQPPHVKMAVEHVAKYSLNDLKRKAYRLKGCALHPYKRSHLHAVKYYHHLLRKYFILEYKGVHADDQPLTNGAFRERIDAMMEQSNIKDSKEDIFRAVVLGLGVASLAT